MIQAGYHIPRYVRANLPAPSEFGWAIQHDAVLMETIANGATFSAAGRVVGVNKDQASARFHRLRKAMGAQAV